MEAKNLLPVAYNILREYEPAETDAEGKVIEEELVAEELDTPGFFESMKDVIEEMEAHKLVSYRVTRVYLLCKYNFLFGKTA